MNERIRSILSVTNGPDVLDVGCAGALGGGPDWLHGALVDSYPNVWGIDISIESIAALRKRGFVNLAVADAESFELEEQFDTIVAGELIEHVGNPGAFLYTSRRHLKPGGRIVLTTPYPFSLIKFLYALVRFPRTCVNPDHTMWFCPRTLSTLAARNGFRVREWKLVVGYPEARDTSRTFERAVRSLRLLGWMLPRRLKLDDMLFVLEPE